MITQINTEMMQVAKEAATSFFVRSGGAHDR
jgi:hypothetical protein